jgi:hypothetical protein
MPVLGFLAAVGFALTALLFVADATLQKGSPPIVTSERIGLPQSRHSDAIQGFTVTPAPAPDMTSPAVQLSPARTPNPCERLGIELPIIQAPMGSAVGPTLAAAVS